MENQDFERYARIKPINLNVADTWAVVFTEAISRLKSPATEVKVLDYGCGDGKYFDHWIMQRLLPENLHGVDVSRIRVERCHSLGWSNARFIEKGDQLPFADGSFHIVNCMEVIEHIPRAKADSTVAEIRRVLKPGGMLLISTPNYPIKRFYDLFDAVVHRMWPRLRDDPTHVSFYSHRRLENLLKPYFASLENRLFKPGFLYKRLPWPILKHKIFLICHV